MKHRRSIPLVAFTTAVIFTAVAAYTNAATAPGAWKPSWEARIAPAGEPGAPFVMDGRVLSFPDSQPLPHVRVRAYHADTHGRYRADGPGGTFVSGDHGEYRIRSVFPGLAEGEPHVHFQFAGADGSPQLYTVTFARRRGAGSDTTFARLSYLLQLPKDSPWQYVEYDADGVLHVHADVVVGWARRVPAR